MEATAAPDHEGRDPQVVAIVPVQRQARLAEHRPLAREPEVPLQDDREEEVIGGRSVVVYLDADRHAGWSRRVPRADAPSVAVIALVVHPVGAEPDRHRVIDRTDEAIGHDLDAAAEAGSEPRPAAEPGRVEDPEQQVRLGLEAVLRSVPRLPDGALRQGGVGPEQDRRDERDAKVEAARRDQTIDERVVHGALPQHPPQATLPPPQSTAGDPSAQVTSQSETSTQRTWHGPSHSTAQVAIRWQSTRLPG